MTIDNSSNGKQEVGGSDAGLHIELEVGRSPHALNEN